MYADVQILFRLVSNILCREDALTASAPYEATYVIIVGLLGLLGDGGPHLK